MFPVGIEWSLHMTLICTEKQAWDKYSKNSDDGISKHEVLWSNRIWDQVGMQYTRETRDHIHKWSETATNKNHITKKNKLIQDKIYSNPLTNNLNYWENIKEVMHASDRKVHDERVSLVPWGSARDWSVGKVGLSVGPEGFWEAAGEAHATFVLIRTLCNNTTKKLRHDAKCSRLICIFFHWRCKAVM